MTVTTINEPLNGADRNSGAWASLAAEYQRFPAFYGLFAAWFAVTFLATFYFGDTMIGSVALYLNRTMKLAWMLVGGVVLAIIATQIIKRDLNPVRSAVWFCSTYIGRELAVRVVAALVSFPVLMACFLYWKMKIPLALPFVWDETFARWDAALMGGYQAWEWLLPYFGSPAMLRFIDGIYTGWGPLCVAFWVFAIAAKGINQFERDRFLLAFLLAWLLIGLVAATALSSAGPVYYHHLTGDYDMYWPLIDHLRSMEQPWALDPSETRGRLKATWIQSVLWGVHTGGWNGIGGISAMPSMHNAQVLLLTLFTFRISRMIGWFMVGYTIVIFIGSMVLGWHYMLDGVVGIVMMLGVWWLATVITRRYHPKHEVGAPALAISRN